MKITVPVLVVCYVCFRNFTLSHEPIVCFYCVVSIYCIQRAYAVQILPVSYYLCVCVTHGSMVLMLLFL